MCTTILQKVPVIRDDDEDFKASSSSSRSKGKAGKMSQHRSGQKRKKARIRDDSGTYLQGSFWLENQCIFLFQDSILDFYI